MSKTERALIAAILLLVLVFATYCIGEKYWLPLAAFDALIGIIIGMVLFIPNNDGGW